MISKKTPEEIEKMREAGRIHAEVMKKLVQNSVAGVSTLQLDNIAEKEIRRFGADPSFKGYRGFPASICTSLNEEVVHGIPSVQKVLKEGDLLKLDLGVKYKGFHADAGRTVAIGSISKTASKLMNVTKQAFFLGIQQAVIGNHINDIGRTIQGFVEKNGFSVVRELVGHGVGKHLHEDPEIPNFFRPDLKIAIEEGMTLAVEPMVNIGSWRIKTLADNWTVITADRKLSAYYEDTIAITQDGPIVLTNSV